MWYIYPTTQLNAEKNKYKENAQTIRGSASIIVREVETKFSVKWFGDIYVIKIYTYPISQKFHHDVYTTGMNAYIL